MIVSPHVKKVISVELNQQAHKDALNNAKMNHLTNMQFINQDATEFMKDYSHNHEYIDGIIMDPPHQEVRKNSLSMLLV